MFIAFQQERENGEVLRGTIDTYKGKTYVGIRSWYKGEATGDLLPGKNGINLRLSEFEMLKEAVEALEPKVKSHLTLNRSGTKKRDEEEEQEEEQPVKRSKKGKKFARR